MYVNQLYAETKNGDISLVEVRALLSRHCLLVLFHFVLRWSLLQIFSGLANLLKDLFNTKPKDFGPPKVDVRTVNGDVAILGVGAVSDENVKRFLLDVATYNGKIMVRLATIGPHHTITHPPPLLLMLLPLFPVVSGGNQWRLPGALQGVIL